MLNHLSILTIVASQLGGFWLAGLATPAAIRANDELKPITLRVTVDGKSHVGRPVVWNPQQFVMLRRDGRMLQFNLGDVTDFARQSEYFIPYDASKIQRHLQKLFKGHEVSRTAHYVVVHPPGQRSRWAEPFEQLYRRFSQYFHVRGFTQSRAEFPMVVVVLRSRSEFNAVAERSGVNSPNRYVGFYSPESNWVVTYQQSAGATGRRWDSDHLTLIHEALHQYAFNRGIHSRWAETPTWCAEGLASMFETRGINDSAKFRSARDRIHHAYLPQLHAIFSKPKSQGFLRQMIASDRMFSENIDVAYALAWGMSYYLAETRPGQFNRYLQRVADRPSLEAYDAKERLADFAKFFGQDYAGLESQWRQHMGTLK